jgi:hypothetical protein
MQHVLLVAEYAWNPMNRYQFVLYDSYYHTAELSLRFLSLFLKATFFHVHCAATVILTFTLMVTKRPSDIVLEEGTMLCIMFLMER